MKEQGNKPFWDRRSGFYDRFMRLYDAIAAKMKSALNQHMYVLELACGTGLIGGYFWDLFFAPFLQGFSIKDTGRRK